MFYAPLNEYREPKFVMWVNQRPVIILKLRKLKRAKIGNMGISNLSHHIQIKIKIPNPSQEPPASSKAPNEDLKDMDVLCNFKIEIEQKFGSCFYQTLVTKSESRSRCQIPVSHLQHPPCPT